jgi:hypothetical protein
MGRIHEDLSHRIRILEKELQTALEDKGRAFRYRWIRGKAKFEEEILAQHRALKLGVVPYVLGARILAVLSAPLIYLGIVPFGLLDLFLLVFQAICFRVYEIPVVRRDDYIVFDRGRLEYLNMIERLNCLYCSYTNGLLAYAAEVAARTEQHWCPIKHARRLRAPHSRYPHFFEYGDAHRYQQQIEAVRNDFVDLRTLTSPKPRAGPK